MNHISFVVHFRTPNFQATAWSTSLAVILGTLPLMFFAGAWILRRVEL